MDRDFHRGESSELELCIDFLSDFALISNSQQRLRLQDVIDQLERGEAVDPKLAKSVLSDRLKLEAEILIENENRDGLRQLLESGYRTLLAMGTSYRDLSVTMDHIVRVVVPNEWRDLVDDLEISHQTASEVMEDGVKMDKRQREAFMSLTNHIGAIETRAFLSLPGFGNATKWEGLRKLFNRRRRSLDDVLPRLQWAWTLNLKADFDKRQTLCAAYRELGRRDIDMAGRTFLERKTEFKSYCPLVLSEELFHYHPCGLRVLKPDLTMDVLRETRWWTLDRERGPVSFYQASPTEPTDAEIEAQRERRRACIRFELEEQSSDPVDAPAPSSSKRPLRTEIAKKFVRLFPEHAKLSISGARWKRVGDRLGNGTRVVLDSLIQLIRGDGFLLIPRSLVDMSEKHADAISGRLQFNQHCEIWPSGSSTLLAQFFRTSLLPYLEAVKRFSFEDPVVTELRVLPLPPMIFKRTKFVLPNFSVFDWRIEGAIAALWINRNGGVRIESVAKATDLVSQPDDVQLYWHVYFTPKALDSVGISANDVRTANEQSTLVTETVLPALEKIQVDRRVDTLVKVPPAFGFQHLIAGKASTREAMVFRELNRMFLSNETARKDYALAVYAHQTMSERTYCTIQHVNFTGVEEHIDRLRVRRFWRRDRPDVVVRALETDTPETDTPSVRSTT